MYLGIDLGTSGVKSVLVDEEQRIVAEHSSRPLQVSRPRRGWAEQDPSLWWSAVCESLDGLAANHGRALSQTRGIGLSGQMYGATCLDAADEVLRPAILWNDTRTARECAELEAREPETRRIAGRKPTPGVTAPKLAWLKRHEPETFAKVRSVLLPKDHVRLELTGDKASDMADSSGTFWMDVAARDWSDRMLAATDMDRSQMPKLYEGTEATGRLRPVHAARWGMLHAPIVAAGGGDNACGACGAGVIGTGQGTVSLGTSGVLFVAADTARSSPVHAIETLCHSVPGAWHQMSVILSATSCLNWLGQRLKRPASELVAELGAACPAASPLLFVPYLDGCWSPSDDPDIRGALVGLSHGTDDAALTQAVLQGVVFALMESAEAFRSTGTPIERLLAIGGGSRSELWLKMIATTLGVEIAVPASSELGAAFGAARLAMIAATNAPPATILTPPPIRSTIAPDAALVESYGAAYREWLALVPAIRGASKALPSNG